MTFQTVEQLQATVAEQAQQIENLKIAARSDYDEGYNDARSDHEDVIASLTAENERLRAYATSQEFALILLYEEVKELFVDNALINICQMLEKTRAALQPKEGEQ